MIFGKRESADISSLNDEQLLIFKNIIKNVKNILDEEGIIDKENKIFSISGFAGSGKTYLTAKIIQELLSKKIKLSITTPTHKAVNVLREMLKSNNIDTEDYLLSIGTIHRFLNLKLDYGFDNEDDNAQFSEKPKLVENKYKENMEYVDVLFVDEASMVSESLYQMTLKILGDRAKVIVFIGDEFQLLPVEDGGDNSIFNKPEIVHYKLTKIVRQSEDSAIIQKSQQLIEYLKTKKYPETLREIFTESLPGITLMNQDEMYKHYFNENSYEEDKIVGCFTNKRVDEYNAYLRYMTLNTLDYLHKDDILVFQQPYTNHNDDIIFNNGEIVEIQSLKLVDDITYGWKVWKVKMQGEIVYILDPQSEYEYNEMLEQLKNEARIATGKNRKSSWRKFFKLKNKYAKVKYDYSSTLHKLQGSTYKHVYFDTQDILSFYKQNKNMCIRLCYVAITRASKEVFIIQ